MSHPIDNRVPCHRNPAPLIVLLAWCLLAQTGCRTVQASMLHSPDVETHPEIEIQSGTAFEDEHADVATESEVSPASRWPSRWGNKPDRPGVIIALDRPWSEFRAAHIGRYSTMRSSEIEYNDAAILAGGLGIETGFRFKPEGPGSFVFVPRVDPSDEPSTKPEPDLAFKFVSARPIVQNFVVKSAKLNEETGLLEIEGDSSDEEEHVRLERTWFTLRMPDESDRLMGTLVLLPGMFGTPEPVVDGVESYFIASGWAVLRMMSHPSSFTGYRQFDVEPGHEEIIGEMTAKLYDQRTAECAYAARAALRHVQAQRPQLAEHPTALLGMSGGAMVLPTVYAYDPDLYDAAVLIAGGANSMLITAMSNYREMIDAVRFDFDPSTQKLDEDGTREQLLALSSAYLAESKLDAIHTAEEMRDIPVLMLHASRDKAVPSRRGDDLYRALGQPERWKYPVGHELIFAALPIQVPKIHNWMIDELELEIPTAGTDASP